MQSLPKVNPLSAALPVAIASRATTEIEARYPQLDLEALAIDFGLRRFRQYLLGNPTINVHTDHKPLVAVFKNSRHGSVRTERIKLRHQDITFIVQHIPGEQNPADFCSRHPTPLYHLPNHIQQETNECEKLIYNLMSGGIISEMGASNIATASKTCSQLSKLTHHIHNGTCPGPDDDLIPFKNVFHELTTTRMGTVLRGERIIIPESLRQSAL